MHVKTLHWVSFAYIALSFMSPFTGYILGRDWESNFKIDASRNRNFCIDISTVSVLEYVILWTLLPLYCFTQLCLHKFESAFKNHLY
jgi:hypothetical protein